MPEEKRPIIDKSTLIPISLVLAVCMTVWYASALNSRVLMNTGRVEYVETKIEQTPSRIEFTTLQETVDEIRVDVKSLLSK